MKIKFSIILCLFPFTLSSPPLSYTTLLPSFIDIQANNQFFPSFRINIPGIYIWTISHKPKKSKLIVKEPDPMTFINLKMRLRETYIVLKVNTNKECQAYYWIGGNSALEDRQMTARFVVRLMYDLSMQIEGSKLTHLSREEQNKESIKFRQIFTPTIFTGSDIPIPKLFKGTGDDGDLFMEVPLKYDELNGTDTFVLDKTLFIYIWNANPDDNQHKIDKAMALAKRITRVDKRELKGNTKIKVVYKSMDHFKSQFLGVLEDVPSFAFPEPQPQPNLPFPTPNNQLQAERNGHLLLLEYSINNDYIIWQEIHSRPLSLFNLHTKKTYLMIDFYVDGLFIYIGKSVHYAQIEEVMVAAEVMNWHMPNYKWKKVTLIRHSDKLPTHFIINFPEGRNDIQNFMTHH